MLVLWLESGHFVKTQNQDSDKAFVKFVGTVQHTNTVLKARRKLAQKEPSFVMTSFKVGRLGRMYIDKN